MNRKTAFVTGGSRGIGRGIVQTLAENGYDVAFTYHSKADEAAALKAEVKKLGVRCYYYQATLQEADVPARVTQQAIADLGRVDVMVCNAGLTVHNKLLTLTPEEIDFAYDLDYRGYLLCAQVAAKQMIEKEIHGRIIMISSTRGIRAYPEDPLYGGMKAALHRAVESLALELSQYHITVNCVAPGATAVRGNYTPEELTAYRFLRKIPAGRQGTPREVAGVVNYLAGDMADYITGSVIRVDGGLILSAMPLDGSPEAGPAWSDLPRHMQEK